MVKWHVEKMKWVWRRAIRIGRDCHGDIRTLIPMTAFTCMSEWAISNHLARMQRGNVFGRTCLCVCVSVCLYVLRFESLDLDSSYLYASISSESSGQVRISRSIGHRVKVKVTGAKISSYWYGISAGGRQGGVLFANGVPSTERESCFKGWNSCWRRLKAVHYTDSIPVLF